MSSFNSPPKVIDRMTACIFVSIKKHDTGIDFHIYIYKEGGGGVIIYDKSLRSPIGC